MTSSSAGNENDSPLEIGARVGDLLVERELGRGGFAVVYRARDTLLDRTVALKVLRPPEQAGADAPEREAVLAEARLVAGLNNPHVVTLYRVHERPGGWMFEMEYVEGGSLRDLLDRDGRLPYREAARLLSGVLSGLDAAHARGVLHRDIKPENVLLGRDRSIKIADFGMASVGGENSLHGLPEGAIVGTPAYMPPEVMLGEEPSPASDLWSFGVMAYEMLTGRSPFPAKGLPALFFAVQNAPPAPFGFDVPPSLESVIRRCLAKRPADRAQSCAELHDDVMRTSGALRPEDFAPPPAAPAGLHGRDDEMGRLEAVLAQAAGGGVRTVLVTGEAGIGKSALFDALRERALQRGVLWLRAPVSPVEGPLRGLVEAAQHALTSDRGASGAFDEREFGAAAPFLNEVVAGGVADGRLESQAQVLWALEHLLKGAAKERVVCVFVDDAQHAQEDDVVLLDALAQRMSGAQLLLAIAARPTSEGAFARLATAERIVLGGLGKEALYAYLEQVAGAGVPPEVAGRIAERCDGNPLFAAELLRHMEGSGALVRDGGRFALTAKWHAAALPDRFHDVVASRLTGLEAEDRALLEVAAVDGRAFDGKALAAVLGLPLLAVLRRLQGLCRSQTLICPREAGYAFVSNLLQQVLYEEMSPEMRTEVHRELAEHLEARPDGVEPERLARHFERCGRVKRAVPHLLRAARAAWNRQEPRRFLDFATRAGLLGETLDEEAVGHDTDLLFHLSRTLLEHGRLDEWRRLVDALEAHGEARGDEQLVMRVNVVRAASRAFTGGVSEEDAAYLERAAEVLEDPRRRGHAHYLCGVTRKRKGDLATAAEHFEQADALFGEGGDDRMHSATRDQLGSVALRDGRLEEAERFYAEAARISARIGRRGNAAASEINRVTTAMQRGALDGLEPILERAARTFELEGIPHHAAQVRIVRAALRYALGDTDGALASLDEAVPELRRTKHVVALASAVGIRGHFLTVRGALDEARAALEDADRLARDVGDSNLRCSAHARLALLHCVAGSTDRAVESARAAVESVTTSQIGVELVGYLVQAVLCGLPVDPLADLRGALHASDPAADSLILTRARRVLDAAEALGSDTGGTDALHAGAAALRSPEIGEGRAVSRVVGACLAAEALRRVGNSAAAVDEATDGLREAQAMGHVWLQAVLLGFLARVSPGQEHDARCRELVEGVAARMGDPADRERLLRAW